MYFFKNSNQFSFKTKLGDFSYLSQLKSWTSLQRFYFSEYPESFSQINLFLKIQFYLIIWYNLKKERYFKIIY